MSNEAKQTRDGLTQDGNMITILLADDDPDDRQLTRDAFKENRLANSLATVEDGEELLEYLHRHGKFSELKNILETVLSERRMEAKAAAPPPAPAVPAAPVTKPKVARQKEK